MNELETGLELLRALEGAHARQKTILEDSSIKLPPVGIAVSLGHYEGLDPNHQKLVDYFQGKFPGGTVYLVDVDRVEYAKKLSEMVKCMRLLPLQNSERQEFFRFMPVPIRHGPLHTAVFRRLIHYDLTPEQLKPTFTEAQSKIITNCLFKMELGANYIPQLGKLLNLTHSEIINPDLTGSKRTALQLYSLGHDYGQTAGLYKILTESISESTIGFESQNLPIVRKSDPNVQNSLGPIHEPRRRKYWR